MPLCIRGTRNLKIWSNSSRKTQRRVNTRETTHKIHSLSLMDWGLDPVHIWFVICSFEAVVGVLAVCVHELCAPGFERAHCCHVVTFLQPIFCRVRRIWLRILLLCVGRRVWRGKISTGHGRCGERTLVGPGGDG
jgi:hypothetical protein